MKKKLGTLALALAFAAGIFLSACGGGTSGPSPAAGNNPSGPTGSATVTLNVPPRALKGARVILSGTEYFSVVVTLPGSTTVVASGASDVFGGTGTVTLNNIPTGSARKFTVTAYNAPGTGTCPGIVTVCIPPAGQHVISTGFTSEDIVAGPNSVTVVMDGIPVSIIPASSVIYTPNATVVPASKTVFLTSTAGLFVGTTYSATAGIGTVTAPNPIFSINPNVSVTFTNAITMTTALPITFQPAAFYGSNGTESTTQFQALDQDGNTILASTYVPSTLGSGLAVDITVAGGKITAATPNAGFTGINYNIGDTVTVSTGGANCTLTVKTLNVTGEGAGSFNAIPLAGCGTGYATALNVATTFGTSALATNPLTWSIRPGTASLANAGTIDSALGFYTAPMTGTPGQTFTVNVANNLGIASTAAVAESGTAMILEPNTGNTDGTIIVTAPPPAFPTGLAGTGGTGDAILSWTEVGTPASSTVYWGTSAVLATAKTNSFVCGGGSPCTVTVPNDQNNFFVVTATFGADIESAESNTFGPITSLTAPTGVSVAPNNPTSATLTWTPDISATSSNIYFATTTPAYPLGTQILGATSAIAGNVTPLTANTAYYVAATSAIAGAIPPAGNSESSPTQVIYVPTPGAPLAAAVLTSAFYSWPAVAGATSYNVYWTDDLTTPAEILGVAQGTTTKITGATSGGKVTGLTTLQATNFKFIVTANLGGIESAASATGAVAGVGPLPVTLGLAGTFGILAKSGITTTGVTAVVGNMGISPAAASYMTGFGLILDVTNVFSTSSLVTGKIYASNYAPPTPANLTTAISNMMTAYTTAAGLTVTGSPACPGSGNFGTLTLAPGVYKCSVNVTIPTNLTLNGGANDVWVFQISGNLDLTASIILTGGAQPKNIFWQVGGTPGATLETGSVFNGIILSKTEVIMKSGAVLNGRALAQTQVTLIGNTVTAPANQP